MAENNKEIKNIISYYKDVELPGGATHNLPNTLKRIEAYYNGRFINGQYFASGKRKFFYNITKPSVDIAEKFIDLDTKDIQLLSENPGDETAVWLMGKELRQWLKETRFGKTLNTLTAQYPKYGHIFTKKVKGKIETPNILNLRFDPSSPSFEGDVFFYELHKMSRGEVESMEDWDTEELLKRTEDDFFEIYECYDRDGEKWTRTFKGDLFNVNKSGNIIRGSEAELNEETEYLPAITLHTATKVELPYREEKWDDVPGRRLGLGFCEYLFDNQIRVNEIVNMKAKKLDVTSLSLFQTADESLGGKNILHDMDDGDILKTAQGVKAVDNEERNLSAFRDEEARWDANTQGKTFSFDSATGENQPTGTTLGAIQLSTAQIISYYEKKREKLGLLISDVVLNDVLPEFKKRTEKEHIFTFASNDREIDKLDRVIVGAHIEEWIDNYAKQTGFLPGTERIDVEKEKIKSKITKKGNRYLEIPESFYKSLKHRIKVATTGEQVNPNSSTTLQTALQILGQNPQVIQNPATRAILFKLLEIGGFSPMDLDMMEQEAKQAPQAQPQGGAPMAKPQAQSTTQQLTSQILGQ